MPEAPTILMLCGEAYQFVGKKPIEINGSVSEEIKNRILNTKISNIRTYGKQLLLLFPDSTISIHLMLFGSYTINTLKPGKLTLGLKFDKGELNFYASTVKLVEGPVDEVFDQRTEVMSKNFDPKYVLQKLKEQPNEEIIDAMIDQNIFTGVGNKIRNEVLFRMQVHPLNKVKDIPEKKLKEIIKDCPKFSLEMFEWVKEDALKDNLVVYKGKECPRDKVPFIHEKLGSRTIHFCEKCQKLYE